MYLTVEPVLIHGGQALAISVTCAAAVAFMAWFFIALTREQRKGSPQCRVHFVAKQGRAQQAGIWIQSPRPGTTQVARSKMPVKLPGLEGISAGTVLISLQVNHGLGEGKAGSV